VTHYEKKDHFYCLDYYIVILVVMVLSFGGFQRVLDGGPPIQAGFDSMTFLAEQVSHHPPGESGCGLVQEVVYSLERCMYVCVCND